MSQLLVAPIEALTDSSLTETERKVLLTLFSFRGRDTDTVWPSVAAIAERSNISDHTRISKITKSLCVKGWVSKKKKGFTGCNEYILTVPYVENTNLANSSNMDADTSSNLDKNAISNLDKNAKYKEQTIDHTIEQTILSSPEDDLFESSITDQQKKSPNVPHQQIIAMYHEILPMLPRVVIPTWAGSSRERDLSGRWKQHKVHQTLEFWEGFFDGVRRSAWHIGENERGWKADLGWLVKRANFDKIIQRIENEAV